MKILIFAAVIIGIIVDYYVACEFQHIAMEKGFSDRKYFWYTFLLGMIGILMIVALPDRKVNSVQIGRDNSELPDL